MLVSVRLDKLQIPLEARRADTALVQSIDNAGVVNPVVGMWVLGAGYKVIDGYRRVDAAKSLGMTHIDMALPAHVRRDDRDMLELKYDGSKITATFGATTATIKEEGRETGDWSYNVVRNFLDSFGVTYRDLVVHNQDKEQSLHYIDFDGLTVLSSVPIDEGGEQLDLVSSPELETILKALGAE